MHISASSIILHMNFAIVQVISLYVFSMENNNSSQNRSFGKAMLCYLKVQINFDIFTGKPLIVSYTVAGIIIVK